MATKSTEFVVITVETILGARYVFPDMPRRTIQGLMESATRSLHLVPAITFVNASGAALVLPSRIVRSISFDGEVKWRNAAVHELPGAGESG